MIEEENFPPGGIVPLNIKSEEAHRLAKELAQRTGRSLTETVTDVLQQALDRERAKENDSRFRLIQDLNEIALHAASLPVLDNRSAEEILGYNENGLPG